jgi:alpha-glutamyl/putrescinyl thymine pyrophosphorylase clade 1
VQPDLFDFQRPMVEEKPRFVMLHGKRHRVSPVFRTYWAFAAERHSVFLRRLNGILLMTSDPIISRFKFTNAYRILDRTSQYLVREVIHQGDQSAEELGLVARNAARRVPKSRS